ncbi:alkene reductase [Brevibacterium samyangense]|uniref:Alkene reductase n=1 Tax=Brevibacterium samyangense TaxID=366888 RepID=A0ABN2TG21_9MICO
MHDGHTQDSTLTTPGSATAAPTTATATTTPADHALFSPVTLGALDLANRVVMAPLTRLRADENGVPNDLHVAYYSQRATAGLIVAEGTYPHMSGRTWMGQPGIQTPEQVAAWKRVTDAVHAEGGKSVLQVMHGGRVSHPEIAGVPRIVAPSPIASPAPIRLPNGEKVDAPVPEALSPGEIAEVVQSFVLAARNAIEAGFDGVQVHGANGYLLHQFLAPSSNQRADEYGGSPENRARLLVEVTRAVAAEIGADRTSVRLSPQHNVQGVVEDDDADVDAVYAVLAKEFGALGLGFVDVLRAEPRDAIVQDVIRAGSGLPLVVNTGFGHHTTLEEAQGLVEENVGEAVGVGRAVIANPDLVLRWRTGAEENPTDSSTFYVGGARGYTDYPTL